MSYTRSAILAGLLAAIGPCVHAQTSSTTPGATAPEAPAGAAAPAAPAVPPQADAPKSPPLKIGIDAYLGLSDQQGNRTLYDGAWIGFGSAYPSVVYGRWDPSDSETVKASISIGKLYRAQNRIIDQPVEAYYQKRLGRSSITVGKYYVPFGVQEWEYETRPGVMYQYDDGANTVAASVNYNDNRRTTNGYLRVGRKFSERLTFGLSAGTGAGFSFGTDHNSGFGADATVTFNAWQLVSEYNDYRTPDNLHFRFAHGKLFYNAWGPWKPYIGVYSWSDEAKEEGDFRSTVVGVGRQVTPWAYLDGGYSSTSVAHVAWVEAHITWEAGVK
ncbi:hypothetical protein CCAX7_39570 [Capsulimonas corticalis]|uniref:Uncharacterized protein n=1 Tax=Capsulimonas corticalis TaxID=2219043 RepID=A0A402D3I9_9BACT|nr:hypothetical protein [Capsulimonas corticalis]BDI31906.1 hypothetical protein CCAX7_39570 [Capsulimonas corticalis]